MYLFCAAGLIFPAAVAFVSASLKQRAYSGGNQICHTISEPRHGQAFGVGFSETAVSNEK